MNRIDTWRLVTILRNQGWRGMAVIASPLCGWFKAREPSRTQSGASACWAKQTMRKAE